jgi:hypothetical protein
MQVKSSKSLEEVDKLLNSLSKVLHTSHFLNRHKSFKGIVSRDWGGLLMVSVDR